MTQDEYILGLLAIISGMAVTHTIGVVHLLLFNRKRVGWDWLAPLTAGLITYLILYSWWVSWAAFHGRETQILFGWFLLPVSQLICLFLAARAILPENGDQNLKEHYATVSRYVWGALTANLVLVLFGLAMRYAITGMGPSDAINLPQLIVGLAIGLALAVLRWRTVHVVLVPLLCVMTLAGTLTKPL